MRRSLPAVVAVLGVALVVGGVVVFVVAGGSGAPFEFGWTSYRPLESEFGYRSESRSVSAIAGRCSGAVCTCSGLP
jgi:heme/copper-type cytochrome/quinol oxidase subunit 1